MNSQTPGDDYKHVFAQSTRTTLVENADDLCEVWTKASVTLLWLHGYETDFDLYVTSVSYNDIINWFKKRKNCTILSILFCCNLGPRSPLAKMDGMLITGYHLTITGYQLYLCTRYPYLVVVNM